MCVCVRACRVFKTYERLLRRSSNKCTRHSAQELLACKGHKHARGSRTCALAYVKEWEESQEKAKDDEASPQFERLDSITPDFVQAEARQAIMEAAEKLLQARLFLPSQRIEGF